MTEQIEIDIQSNEGLINSEETNNDQAIQDKEADMVLETRTCQEEIMSVTVDIPKNTCYVGGSEIGINFLHQNSEFVLRFFKFCNETYNAESSDEVKIERKVNITAPDMSSNHVHHQSEEASQSTEKSNVPIRSSEKDQEVTDVSIDILNQSHEGIKSTQLSCDAHDQSEVAKQTESKDCTKIRSDDSHIEKKSKKRKLDVENENEEHTIKKEKVEKSKNYTVIIGRKSLRLKQKPGGIMKSASERKARLNDTLSLSPTKEEVKKKKIPSKTLQSLKENKATKTTSTRSNRRVTSEESQETSVIDQAIRRKIRKNIEKKMIKQEVDTDENAFGILTEIGDIGKGIKVEEISDIDEIDKSLDEAMFMADVDDEDFVDDDKDSDYVGNKGDDVDDEGEEVGHTEQKMNNKRPSRDLKVSKSRSKVEKAICTECGKVMPKKQYPSHLRFAHKILNAFKCKKCNKTFNSSMAFRKHELWHNDEDKRGCKSKKNKNETMSPNTDEILKSPEKMSLNQACESESTVAENEAGIEKDQDKKETFTCNICLKILRSEEGLKKHMEIHTSGQLHCNICNKHFVTRQRLQIHEMIHNENKLVCQVCQAEFNHPRYFIQHCRKNHDDQRDVCNLCGIFFDNAFEKNKHKLTHMQSHCSNFICPKCGKTFELMRYLKTHNKQCHNGTEHICKICCKFFTSKVELRKHMWEHRQDYTYMCNICKCSFESSGALTSHMKNDHNCRMYVCETCGEQFNNSVDFKKHIIYEHNPDCLHSCEKCDSKFFARRKLLEHMERVHTEKRPYQCDECGTCFKTNNTLQKHILTHKLDHWNTCTFCNAKYRSIDGLNNHVLDKHFDQINPERLTFRVYECEFCGKKTSQKTIHIRHVRAHTGEKPYRCDFCGKMFPQTAALNRHIKHKHTQGAKKYSCDICGMKFAELSRLNRHFRTQSHKLKEGGLPESTLPNETENFEELIADETQMKVEAVEDSEDMQIVYLDANSKETEQVYTIEGTSMLNLPESTIYVISHPEDPGVIVELQSEHS